MTWRDLSSLPVSLYFFSMPSLLVQFLIGRGWFSIRERHSWAGIFSFRPCPEPLLTNVCSPGSFLLLTWEDKAGAQASCTRIFTWELKTTKENKQTTTLEILLAFSCRTFILVHGGGGGEVHTENHLNFKVDGERRIHFRNSQRRQAVSSEGFVFFMQITQLLVVDFGFWKQHPPLQSSW